MKSSSNCGTTCLAVACTYLPCFSLEYQSAVYIVSVRCLFAQGEVYQNCYDPGVFTFKRV